MKTNLKPLTWEEADHDIKLLVKRIWTRAYLDTEESHQELLKDLVSSRVRALEEENKRLQERLEAADKIIQISSPSDLLLNYQKDLELREKYNSLKP